MTKHRSKRLPIEQHQGGGIALDRTHRHAGRIQAVWAHLVGGGENLAVAELADWINVPGGAPLTRWTIRNSSLVGRNSASLPVPKSLMMTVPAFPSRTTALAPAESQRLESAVKPP